MTGQDNKPLNQAELPLGEPVRKAETPSEPAAGEVLEWTSHPLKRRPWVSAGVTLFVLLVGLVVYLATASNAFTVLALVVMYASLAKFYFPTRYKMTERGVQIKTLTQTLFKDWSIYRSFYPDKNGVLLSPFTLPSRLENFRGLYVMFEGNRDRVVDFVGKHVGRKVEAASKNKAATEPARDADSAEGSRP